MDVRVIIDSLALINFNQ